MISSERLGLEMVSCMGYYLQTVRLHPEKAEAALRYLKSEHDRFAKLATEREKTLNILDRGIIW